VEKDMTLQIVTVFKYTMMRCQT